MDSANVEIVRRNQGFIIFLSVELDTILSRIADTGDRPLFRGGDREAVRKLYESRTPVYNAIADCIAEAGGAIPDVASAIRTMLEG